MTRTVAVLQSNYVPWKGYFDLIHDADLFVFYDDVQYTKNDWRNRNKIKVPSGTAWLTVPVGASLSRRICDVEIPDRHWQAKHWKSLQQHYGGTPYFERLAGLLKEVYLERHWTLLSELNQFLIVTLARDHLGIRTQFARSSDFTLQGARLDRLLELLRATGASRYVSGPSARAYIDESRFIEAGIELQFKSYEGYPEYPQRYPPFEHSVSVLDLLCNAGPQSADYIWGWRA